MRRAGVRSAWLLAAACALSVFAAAAQARPGLPELRGEALARLRASEVAKNSLIGIAPLPQTQDAAADYLADLFQDEGFIAVTHAWLDTTQATSSDGVYREWARYYEQTISAGVAVLDDEDLATLTRLLLLRWLDDSGETCERLMAATRVDQLDGLRPYTDAELSGYFRILKRAYLGALANEKPRPSASRAQVARAGMEMLAALPQEERGRLIRFATNSFPDVVTSGLCTDIRRLVQALDAVPGEDGAALRRSFNLSVVRAAFDTTPPKRKVASDVSDTSSKGMFQPGPIQLTYPPTAARAGVEGEIRVRVWVDAQGYAERVKVVNHDLKPAVVTMDDGSEAPSHELFEPLVIAYYQSGRFQRRFKDGKPTSYTAEIPMNWKLE